MSKNRNRGQEIIVSSMEAVLIDMMVRNLKAVNKRHVPFKHVVVCPRKIPDRVAFIATVDIDGEWYGSSIDITATHLPLNDKEQAIVATTMTANMKRVLNGGPLFTEKVAAARTLLENLNKGANAV